MERKCAIYNRLSYGTPDDLAKKTSELINYCVNELHINDFVVFEEISSVNDERKEFNDMMNRIKEKEFTDALTTDLNRYCRYDNKKLGNIIREIDNNDVTIHFKNDKSVLYVRKVEEDSNTLEEQKNKLKEYVEESGVVEYNIVENYQCGDNLARFLECDADVYIGFGPENNKTK
ncbi:MAG: recombinase family protein [Clostridiales bacterium]|nr:recombinase family protein [Clostridiales bacterium]